jgi:hypothetical protein
MTDTQDTVQEHWLGVVGRSLAFLSLHAGEMREEPLLTQARFLEGLGLKRREAARMLGTSVESLGALERQARKKKGGRRGKAKRPNSRRS